MLEKATFSTFCKQEIFHREPVFLKASGCRPCVGLRRFFFGKFTLFFFLDMSIFWKIVFSWFLVISQKWLPRPNHYAHMKGIEILCKTPVRMSRDVPSESNSMGTNSKYSSPARMSTWTSRWRRRRRRRRPKNPPHLVRPLEYHLSLIHISEPTRPY